MCMKLSKNKREKDFHGIGTVGLAARVGVPLVLLPADCFEGSWEETTLSQLAPASWALLIIAKLSPACTSASFSRLRDPGEWVGGFAPLEIPRSCSKPDAHQNYRVAAE